MNQLTIRGFPPEIEKALKTMAKTRGISMNKAALYLLGRGAGLRSSEEKPIVIGNSLDAYFGSLNQEDADAMQSALKELDRVREEAFWK